VTIEQTRTRDTKLGESCFALRFSLKIEETLNTHGLRMRFAHQATRGVIEIKGDT
jgi:hypothetical protein